MSSEQKHKKIQSELAVFNDNFLRNYLIDAPTPLAIERSWECILFSQEELKTPILDIGCGDGIFARSLFKSRVNVGIDPNKVEIDRAADTMIYDELLLDFGDKIHKKDKSFNTIFSNSVLEHIEDIHAVLLEAKRLLKTDGTLYLTVPTDNFEKFSLVACLLRGVGMRNLARAWHRFFNNFWQHHHCYNSLRWRHTFEEVGFKLVDMKFYGTKTQCVMNDIMAPFCILAFLNRKLFRRWFIFTKLRKLMAQIIIYPCIKNFAKIRVVDEQNAGLVFFKLRN